MSGPSKPRWWHFTMGDIIIIALTAATLVYVVRSFNDANAGTRTLATLLATTSKGVRDTATAVRKTTAATNKTTVAVDGLLTRIDTVNSRLSDTVNKLQSANSVLARQLSELHGQQATLKQAVGLLSMQIASASRRPRIILSLSTQFSSPRKHHPEYLMRVDATGRGNVTCFLINVGDAPLLGYAINFELAPSFATVQNAQLGGPPPSNAGWVTFSYPIEPHSVDGRLFASVLRINPGPSKVLRLYATVFSGNGYYAEDDFAIRVVP